MHSHSYRVSETRITHTIYIIMPTRYFTLTSFSAQNINIFFFTESFIINTLAFYDHGCYNFFSLKCFIENCFFYDAKICESFWRVSVLFLGASVCCTFASLFFVVLVVLKIIRSQIYVDVIKQWITGVFSRHISRRTTTT